MIVDKILVEFLSCIFIRTKRVHTFCYLNFADFFSDYIFFKCSILNTISEPQDSINVCINGKLEPKRFRLLDAIALKIFLM